MKQQLTALGASLIFFAIGAAFLFLVRGFSYIAEFIALLDGDIFTYAAMVVLIFGIVIGFQQAVYWFVIRRMEVDHA